MDLCWVFMKEMDLSVFSFYGLVMDGVKLIGSCLWDINFSYFSLWGVNFWGVDLIGVNFIGVDLIGVDLMGVNLIQVVWYDVVVEGVNWEEAIVDQFMFCEGILGLGNYYNYCSYNVYQGCQGLNISCFGGLQVVYVIQLKCIVIIKQLIDNS